MIFINHLETGLSNKVAKFADNNKLFQVVKTRRDYEELQKDLSMGNIMADALQCK